MKRASSAPGERHPRQRKIFASYSANRVGGFVEQPHAFAAAAMPAGDLRLVASPIGCGSITIASPSWPWPRATNLARRAERAADQRYRGTPASPDSRLSITLHSATTTAMPDAADRRRRSRRHLVDEGAPVREALRQNLMS